MKKNDLVIVIIFIIFLFIPNISYWFLKDKMDNSNYENRNLSVKPEFNYKSITEFPKKYENYYNDNLAYKNEIRKIRANINYKFGISSSERVIVGKNGWLFYNSIASESADSISDYRKNTRYSLDEKKKIKTSLLSTKNKLEEKNIDFYIFILPNKENVYSDYLQSKIKAKNSEFSKTEDLINYLNKNTDLNIVYPKDTLISNRIVKDTYYKYDTHWNNYGAYLGTIELMNKIDNNFDNKKIKLGETNYSGDLAMMNLTLNLTNNEPTVINFYDSVSTKCKEKTEFNDCKSSNPVYDKTILFVGDSFRNNTIQYLSKIYKRSIFVHKSYYKQNIMEKYNIDIIIYEAVERYSSTLYNTDMLINE